MAIERRIRLNSDGTPSSSAADTLADNLAKMSKEERAADNAEAQALRDAEKAEREAPYKESQQLLADALGRTEDGQIIIKPDSSDLWIKTSKADENLLDQLNEAAVAAGLPADTFKSNRDMQYGIAVDANLIKEKPELLSNIRSELDQPRLTDFAAIKDQDQRMEIQATAIALDQLNGTNLFGNSLGFTADERAQAEANLNTFKEAHGLPADGVVDQKTMEALREELASQGMFTTPAFRILDDTIEKRQPGSSGRNKAELNPETGQLESTAPKPVGIVGVEALQTPVPPATVIPVTPMGESQGYTAPIPAPRPEEQGREVLTDKQSVEKAQQALKDLGYDINPDGKFQNDGVDGIKGRVTTAELKKFQEENGLAATGEITKETLQKLEEKQAEMKKGQQQGHSAPEVSSTLAMSAESAAAQAGAAPPAPPPGLAGMDMAALGAAVTAAKGMDSARSIVVENVEHDQPVTAKAGGVKSVESGAFLA